MVADIDDFVVVLHLNKWIFMFGGQIVFIWALVDVYKLRHFSILVVTPEKTYKDGRKRGRNEIIKQKPATTN